MKICIILVVFFILIVVPNTNHAAPNNTPRLPEPMVFDLVLPLGASKNEFEVNTLFQYDFANDSVELNPEFEYAYADGYGIELELPMKNTAIDAYKLALQGTFNFLNNRKFIHGW